MRILLKISGEALAGSKGTGLDHSMLEYVVLLVKDLLEKKVEVGIVVGAGNFVRGADIQQIDRCNADNMGMLAVNMNAIALQDVFHQNKMESSIMNAFSIDGIVERFNKNKASQDLELGKVLIFSGGTGNPYFTTDTAGVLRALEIDADCIIKATKVDGVYDKDPENHSDALFIEKASYDEVIIKNLKVMDLTAIALAKQNNLPIKIGNLSKKGAIQNLVFGKQEGTTIS